MDKIAIIGTGQVGSTTAQLLASNNVCSEIVLIGRDDKKAKGMALDIEHANSLYNSDVTVNGSNCFDDLTNAKVVVITNGITRKPGMSRLDLMDANRKVIDPVLNAVMKHAPDALLIMVTNPVDVLTYYAWEKTGWDKNRIMGLSCVLDSARMTSLIAKHTGFSVSDITSMVIGGHGDSMLPLPEYSTVKGTPINNILSKEQIKDIILNTRNAGTAIVEMKGSSGYVAAAASIVEMIDAIVNNKRQILPCVGIAEDDYGLSDVAIGLPMLISDMGIEEIVAIHLTDEQMRLLHISANEVIEKIKQLHDTDTTYKEKPVLFKYNFN